MSRLLIFDHVVYGWPLKDLTQAQKLAQDHILDESKLALFLKDTDKYLKSCASMVQMSQPLDFQQKNLPMLTGINSSMPSLSPAVKIEYSQEVLKTLKILNPYSENRRNVNRKFRIVRIAILTISTCSDAERENMWNFLS